MKKVLSLIFLALLPMVAVYTFTSCGDDDVVVDPSGGNNNGNNINPKDLEIIVTIDADGKADGGHYFTKINESTFYIDDIKYRAKDGNLEVEGYNKALFNGEAKIINTLVYHGRHMKVTDVSGFYDCKVLTSIIIPNSVMRLSQGGFADCINLTSAVIGNGVTQLEDGLFADCINLTSVTIGNGVTRIDEGVFRNCSSLTSITIPNNVTWISGGAFRGCSSLTSITIPSSVTSIISGAFSGCTGLTSIKVSAGNTKYDSRNNCNAIIETATNTLIVGCKNTIFPSSVTSIGGSAFSGCSVLTSITIPSSVTSIGGSAFSGCTGLTSIKVSAGNTKYDSRNNCNAIIETATNTLIAGCKNTIIPNSVTSIDNYAFSGCSSLTSITIPNSVTSIGSHAFYYCSGLTSITIPNSVTSIGWGAFSYCSGLTSVTIPNSVTSIGWDAFSYCSGLTSVTIGNSVTNIGVSAFSGCSNLKNVFCYPTNPPSMDSYVFDKTPISSATLHVPVASIGLYKAAYPWRDFGSIVAL